jgi:RNA polymerase sigma-70 factor, ECF subfamily
VGAPLEEVYAGQYRRLVALVTAVAESRAEAEEAVQEAFVRALGLVGRRAALADPEAWLYRVAVNLVRSRWRRARNGRRLAARLAPEVDDAGSAHARTDSRLVLLAALRKLPFEQREALALHYLADLPVSEVARRVGVPLGTVKARLSRGRDALAGLLADEALKGGGRLG